MPDPIAVPQWLTALMQIGLVGWLILSVAALVFGYVYSRPAVEAERKVWAERLALSERLRTEERTARLESDRRLDLSLQAGAEQTRLLQELRVELVRIAPRQPGGAADG